MTITQHICVSSFGRTHDCWCWRNRDHTEQNHLRDMRLAAALPGTDKENPA